MSSLETGKLLSEQQRSSTSTTMRSLTKMYLLVCLSMACIFIFQYQLSHTSLAVSETDQNSLSSGAVRAAPPVQTSTVTTNEDALSEQTKHRYYIDTSSEAKQLPPVYIITPTFRKPEQLAELTRLGYTLKHVKNLFWLVIEDANQTTPLVTKLLERLGIPFAHLVAPMPEKYRRNKTKPRGVSNRNRGIEWIRANATDGAFYFADDDNTYDIAIFEQIRYTEKVSMWPVGLITKFGLSTPILKNGSFVGFYDGWIGGRKFAVDMAGFAVGVKFLHSRPKASMPFKPGYEEDGFLKSLQPFNMTDVQFLASNCTEILTWHTQTKKNVAAEKKSIASHNNTNLIELAKIIV